MRNAVFIAGCLLGLTLSSTVNAQTSAAITPLNQPARDRLLSLAHSSAPRTRSHILGAYEVTLAVGERITRVFPFSTLPSFETSLSRCFVISAKQVERAYVNEDIKPTDCEPLARRAEEIAAAMPERTAPTPPKVGLRFLNTSFFRYNGWIDDKAHLTFITGNDPEAPIIPMDAIAIGAMHGLDAPFADMGLIGGFEDRIILLILSLADAEWADTPFRLGAPPGSPDPKARPAKKH